MHKPSPSRISFIATIAAAMGIQNYANMSPAQVLHQQRGKAGKGMKWRSSSIYWPGNAYCNVEPTRVKNPKVRAHVQMMHEKWLAAREERLISMKKNKELKKAVETLAAIGDPA